MWNKCKHCPPSKCSFPDPELYVLLIYTSVFHFIRFILRVIVILFIFLHLSYSHSHLVLFSALAHPVLMIDNHFTRSTFCCCLLHFSLVNPCLSSFLYCSGLHEALSLLRSVLKTFQYFLALAGSGSVGIFYATPLDFIQILMHTSPDIHVEKMFFKTGILCV